MIMRVAVGKMSYGKKKAWTVKLRQLSMLSMLDSGV